MVQLSNTKNSLGGVRLQPEPGRPSEVSQMDGRSTATWAITCCLPGSPLAEIYNGRVEPHPGMLLCQRSKCRPNRCTKHPVLFLDSKFSFRASRLDDWPPWLRHKMIIFKNNFQEHINHSGQGKCEVWGSTPLPVILYTDSSVQTVH